MARPKTKRGYGMFTDPETRTGYFAHRLAAALLNGPLPAGALILHGCDVAGHGPRCVNPFHTFHGTQSDNLLHAAGAGFMRRRLRAGQVLEIRALRQAGGVSRQMLAKKFGISRSNVTVIVNNHSWLHLLEPGTPPALTARPWTRKAVCPSGHPYSPENTAIVASTGKRRCRTCNRLRMRARGLAPAYQRTREERLAYYREYDRTRRPRKLEAAQPMTTWTPDSIPEIESKCPGCVPHLDPEGYVLAWCGAHTPDLGGSGDEIAKTALGQESLSGTAEAGGESSRAVCAVIHGTHS